MKSVLPEDKRLVVDILTASFLNNKSVNYIIPQDEIRLYRIQELMAYSFDICSLFGEVMISEDKKACALILYSEQKKTTIKSIWLNIKLVMNCIGIRNIFKVLGRERKIKSIQPKNRMAYLWFIGVIPAYQHFGLGSRLMKEIIEKCTLDKRPIYLETSTTENLPWYKKFGFEIYNEFDFSYTLFFLKWDTQSTNS